MQPVSSAQDVGRGTFSQRHFLLTDQATGRTHRPLAHVVGSTGRLEVCWCVVVLVVVVGGEGEEVGGARSLRL